MSKRLICVIVSFHGRCGMKKKPIKSWRRIRKDIIERDKEICQACSIKCLFFDEVNDSSHPHLLTVDHIIPRRLGGARFDFDNLQVLCQQCHRIKDGNEEVAGIRVCCVICKKNIKNDRRLKKHRHNEHLLPLWVDGMKPRAEFNPFEIIIL